MPYRTRRTLAAAAAFALAACGPLRPNTGPGDPIVLFENQSISQADVYALSSSGTSTRIGTVYPGRTDPLRVPSTATGGDRQVNIVARLFATNRAPRSGNISLGPGDSIRVVLSSDGMVLSALPVR